MLFGTFVVCGGLALTATNHVAPGRTVIRILGAEITLAAAGGIIVIALGVLTFSLPTLIKFDHEPNDVNFSRRISEAPWVPPPGFDSEGWNTAHNFERFYWGVGTRRYPGSKSADCARSLYEELRKSKIDILFVQGNHVAIKMGKTPVSYLCSDGMIFVASFEPPGVGSSDFNAALEIVDRTNFYTDKY